MLESARKLLEIFAAWLGSTQIFLENELLENAWLKFYFPCSKSPSIYTRALRAVFTDFYSKMLGSNFVELLEIA